MQKNINKISRDIKKIYKETDVQMKDIDKVCKSGCSYCCHQVIPVHAAEELPIMKLVSEELDNSTVNQIKTNIENWLNYFEKNTPNKTLNEQDIATFSSQHVKDYIPCPFLIEDKCSIYSARPLVCRTFSVNDNAELCKETPNRLGDERGYKLRDLKLKQIAKTADIFMMRLLPYAVAESFGIKRILKPIGTDVITSLAKVNT